MESFIFKHRKLLFLFVFLSSLAFTLNAQNNFTFTVKDANNFFLSGVSVQISGPANQTLTTNIDGNVLFTNIPDGTYSYTISKTDFETQTGSVVVNAQSPTSKLIILKQFTNVTFHVQKINTNTPLAGVTIHFKDNSVPDQVTNANGDATFTNVVVKNHEIVFTAQGFVPKNSFIDIKPNQQQINENMTPAGNLFLTFNLKDANLNPVGGAFVSIDNLGTRTTNSTGNVVFEMLPPNTYKWFIRANGFLIKQDTVNLTSNRVFNLTLEQAIYATKKVIFIVKDKLGNPIQGVNVNSHYMSANTDPTGKVEFAGLPTNSPVEFWFNKPEFMKFSKVVTANNTADQTIDVILNYLPKMYFSVKKPDNTALANAQVDIWGPMNFSKQTDANGNTFFAVEPGMYGYKVSAQGFVTIEKKDFNFIKDTVQNIVLNPAQQITVNFFTNDNKKNPVPGVLIDFYENYITDVTTDNTGKASFSLPEGQHAYKLIKQGYNIKESGRNFMASEPNIYENIMPTGPYNVEFFIVNDLGLPLSGANVSIDDAAFAQTDGTGKALIANIPAGDHFWRINHPDFAQSGATFTLTASTVIQYKMVKQQYSVKKVNVFVKTPAGLPLNDAVVNYHGGTKTTVNGLVVIDKLPLGQEIWLNVSKPGYTNFGTKIFPTDSADINITAILRPVSPAKVTFIAKDDAGTALKGVRIGVEFVSEFYTDTLGKAIVANLPKGKVIYHAHYNNDYTQIKDSLILDTTNLTVNLKFTKILRNPDFLYIFAVDQSGAPIPFAFIPMEKDTLKFDANGMFKMNNIEVGTYNLLLRKAGYEDTPFSVTIPVSGSVTYKIVMAKKLSGETKVVFEVKDNNGAAITANIAVDNLLPKTTDANGRLELLNLPPGKHKYRVFKDGMINVLDSFNLGTAVLTIPVKMVPFTGKTYKVEFNVKDLPGNFVADAVVRLNTIEKTTTAATTVFDNVPKGIHYFAVSKAGYKIFEGQLVVDTMNVVRNVVLRKLVKVTFNVVSDSKPLPDAMVSVNNLTLKTNANGVAVFENIVEGDLYYGVYKPNFVPVKDMMQANADVIKNITLNPIVFNVAFTVLNETGAAFANATILINGISQTTDANGKTVFNNIPFTPELVYMISAADYVTSKGILFVDKNIDRTIALSKQKFVLKVKVGDGTKALSNADVTLDDGTIKKTNEFGITEFIDLPNGIYKLNIAKEFYNSVNLMAEIKNVNAEIPVLLLPKTYTAVISVVDTNKLPVKYAGVRIGNLTQFTDMNGVVKIPNLRNGKYPYSIEKPGFIGKTDSLTINNADYNATIALIPVASRYKVKFTVTDGTNPVTGANIMFYDKMLVTDGTGNALFENVASGKYLFSVKKEGFVQFYDGIEVLNADLNKQIVLSVIKTPVNFTLASVNFDENVPPHTLLSKINPTEPATNYTFVYYIDRFSNPNNTDNNLFYIKDNNLYANISFNYENKKSYEIDIISKDNYNNYVKKHFIVNIVNKNDLPVILTKPVLNTKTNVAYTYELKATDEDGDNLTVNATQKPAWLTVGAFQNGTAIISGTPAQEGIFNVLLEVKDASTAVLQNFNVVVRADVVNIAPVCVSRTIKAYEDKLVEFNLYATDDKDSLALLKFELTKSPANAGKFFMNGNRIGYLPKLNWSGTDTIRFKARDTYGAWSAEATIILDVAPVNDRPVALSGSFDLSGASKIIDFTNLISDVDGSVDKLKFKFLYTYSETEGKGLFGGRLTPAGSTFWEYTKPATGNIDYIIYSVVDEFNASSETNVITIKTSAAKNTVITEGNIIAQSVVYNDVAAGTPIDIELLGINSGDFSQLNITPSNTVLQNGTIEWSDITFNDGLTKLKGVYTPTKNITATETIPFMVSDGTTSVTAYVVINIVQTPVAPVINSVADKSIVQGNNITVPITFTDNTTAVTWTAAFSPDLTTSGLTYSFTGTNPVSLKVTPPVAYTGNIMITVTGTNSANLSSTINFSIFVSPALQAPALNALNNVSTLKNTAVSVVVKYRDGDSKSPFITWSAKSKLSGTKFEFAEKTDTTVKLNITPATDYIGNDTIWVTVTDEYQLSNTKTFVLSVAEPTAVNQIDNININIYPNPASDFVNIDGIEWVSTLYLFDMHGRVIYSQKLSDKNTILRTSELSVGTYFVKIMCDNKIISKKLTINR